MQATEALIRSVAECVRTELESKYELPLYGKCIEASDLIESKLKELGLAVTSREGWCLYEDEYYGSDRSYDEHTWCEVEIAGRETPLVVDVTLDQFQGGFFEELPRIFVGPLPEFFQYEEPADIQEVEED